MQNFGIVCIFAAVSLLMIPGSLGNSRARAFYALTNHPSEDSILEASALNAAPLIDDSSAYEPLVMLQSAGNDPRCIFCRAGLGKRMSVQVRNEDFRRRV
uniref:Secreted protein n=1 Tax=Panagrolaimus superbus TaxID=310955 RepID=A0A914YJU1_9BILA